MSNNFLMTPILADPVDPNFAGVAVLLHFDGTVGSSNVVDVKGSSIVKNGTPLLSNAQMLAEGNCLDMTAAGTYLSITNANLAFGTGDFTIEGFHRWTVGSSGSESRGVLNIGPGAGGLGGYTNSLAVNMRPNDQKWEIYAGGVISIAATNALVNRNYHYALVRKSGVTKLYVDGQLFITVSDTLNYTATTMALGVLVAAQHAGLGYHDEVRVTKGVARYDGNFIPPTGRFPDK